MNDLDTNYVPRDLQPGQSKDDLLATRMYSFRQGVIVPTALAKMVSDPDPAKSQRVMKAMLEMIKIDLPTLKRAYDGK